MQESYLNADSKGIIPGDLEDRANYLLRAMKLQEAGSDMGLKEKISRWLMEAHLPKDYVACRRSAPERTMDVMINRFDCDVAWVPYYEAKPIRGVGSVLHFWTGLCTSYHDPGRAIYLPVAVHYHFKEREWRLGAHELIHAVRMRRLDVYLGTGKVISELFADSVCRFSVNDVFLDHPLETIRWYSRIKSAGKKLHSCFEAKSDYALIRLNMEEIEYLSRKHVDEDAIMLYFKDKANLSSKHGTADKPKGELRFRIMCEKLGL